MECEPNPNCSYYPHCPRPTKHHIYWPSPEYRTNLERRFREHPENIEVLAWCIHKLLHVEEQPPPKPSKQEMLDQLDEWSK